MKRENIKNSRKLNFEFLRIISMIMIIVHHYVFHNKILYTDSISLNLIISELVCILGKVGVILFVLISGYFMVESKFKIKKVVWLYVEVWMYSVGIFLIMTIFRIQRFNIKDCIKVLFPISYSQYWFITTYLLMYILSPWINKFIKNLKQQEYKILLVILTIMFSIIPTVFPSNKGIHSDLVFFIYLYLIAAYIRLFDISFFNNKKRNIGIVVSCYLFITTVSILCTFVMTKISIAQKGILYFAQINSLPIIVIAVGIFYIF